MTQQDDSSQTQSNELTDLKLPFPWKLHKLLQDTQKNNVTDIVSWQPDGKSFKVHKPKQFTEEIMPSYFSQTKFNSFRRQCYIYGFRLRRDGAFFHPEFLRDNLESCMALKRNQQEDRRKKRKVETAKEKVLPKPIHTFRAPQPPPPPTFIGRPLTAPSVTKKAYDLLEQTVFPDERMDVTKTSTISNLAYNLFEKSQFFDPLFDPLLSLDGGYGDVPLDSLDEIFQSEITERRPAEEILC